MSPQTFETEWGGRTLTVEVGKFAMQAHGACVVRYGDTVVLATAVMSENAREGQSFFPLTVDFEERFYAAGIIKSSRFMKREGRPSDDAILTGRMVDRSIRPLFDNRMRNDVQVVLTTLSVDGENDPDVLCLIAASCALGISGIPWNGPIAGVRVGRIPSDEPARSGEWVLNPTYAAREKSTLDLLVTGTPERVTMIEAGGNEVPEALMVDAIAFAQKHLREPLELIHSVIAALGTKARVDVVGDLDGRRETLPTEEARVLEMARAWLTSEAPKALFDTPKRTKAERTALEDALVKGLEAFLEEKQVAREYRKGALGQVETFIQRAVTNAILEKNMRVDGRGLGEVRSLTAEVGVLPRTHGSAFFTRGETHVLSIVTLGSPGDVQIFEGIEGTGKRRYFHHYNFPPYAVGETSPMRGPGRREIGHGALAERALLPVLPSIDVFPYTIRVVSEVLSSNGSSSMASACASTLALMDAGVPITAPVAGVAMGLASDGNSTWKVITDLQDLEDGNGGMDFKIAGTERGITVIQMDTKTNGLTPPMIEAALHEAREARMTILETLGRAIAAPRGELSPYAPRIITLHINPLLIRNVIGPGGKVINEIIAKTGVDIDIEDDGTIFITSSSKEGMDRAVEWVRQLTHEVAPGEIYDGKVTRTTDFGAFVEILPGQEGLVHVSEIAHERTNRVTDAVHVGDTVKVQIREIDDLGRINLSMKALKPFPEGFIERPRTARPSPYGGSRPPRHGGGARR